MRASALVPVLLLLPACAEEEPAKGDSAEVWEAPLAAPWAGVVAAVQPGGFRSGCAIALDIVRADDGAAFASPEVTAADGGQWGAVAIEPTTLYRATARWDACTNLESGTGTAEVGTFSGEDGIFFVFRYSGSLHSFESLVQREDFEGGAARVTFDAGTTDVAAAAADRGLSAEDEGDGTWRLSWTDTTAVADVLAAFTTLEGYQGGEPVWVRQPDWW